MGLLQPLYQLMQYQKNLIKVLEDQTVRDLKDGINTAVNKVIKYLEISAKPVSGKKIDHVATISSNNDIELGK